MTLTQPTVPADQPLPHPAPATDRTYQNQVLGELLHRCAQHDEAGLARLYELTSPWIYSLVTRLTSSASVADNAMVAIYAEVWRQAARHADDQSILAWITTIAGEETRTIQAGFLPQNTGRHICGARGGQVTANAGSSASGACPKRASRRPALPTGLADQSTVDASSLK